MLQLKTSAAHIHLFCYINNSNNSFKGELTPCICQLGKTNWLEEKEKQIHSNLVGYKVSGW